MFSDLHILNPALFLFVAEMWEIFSPLIAKDCISYQNGLDGKRRRKTYDGSFSHRSMEGFYEGFTQVSISQVIIIEIKT